MIPGLLVRSLSFIPFRQAGPLTSSSRSLASNVGTYLSPAESHFRVSYRFVKHRIAVSHLVSFKLLLSWIAPNADVSEFQKVTSGTVSSGVTRHRPREIKRLVTAKCRL